MRAITFSQSLRGLVGILIILGCAFIAQNQPASASPGDIPEGSSSFDNVEVLDSSLHAKLAILRVGSDRTTTNLLSVFVGLKNKTPHLLKIEVQTIYKDKSDNPLNAGSASWISMILKPHEEMEYRSASISEDGFDFLVRIRRAPATASANGDKTP